MRNENDGKHANNAQAAFHASQNSQAGDRLLPPRGDYRTLLSFQKAEIVYDITFRFCHKFLTKGDRTIDQMIQAARSGKKNILEGSKAGLTSKETDLKLSNVARASLEELLDDYRDFLRARDLAIWDKNSREALFVRKLGRKSPQTFETTVSSARLVRRKSSQISPCALSTKPTISSIDRSVVWKKISSSKVGFASE